MGRMGGRKHGRVGSTGGGGDNTKRLEQGIEG
jgi:hypothetical protein